MEGFAPPEIAQLMNFSTLKNHSGNYITPLFEEKFEDVVWSVEITWEGLTQEVYLLGSPHFPACHRHSPPEEVNKSGIRASASGALLQRG